MFVLENYGIAVLFCVITMLCWGSWGNTQKLAGKTWRFELFYWDYVFGVFLTALVFAFTLGSTGQAAGRGFLVDLAQADPMVLGSAFLGGVVFNAANILLVAAIAIAGMSVAFPVGIGLALVLGVLINFVAQPDSGNPVFLFAGVILVTVAIVLNAIAYRQLPNQKQGGGSIKGIVLAVCCGVLMSLFYFLVARSLAGVEVAGELKSLTAETLAIGTLEAKKITPYTANVVFALGILMSSFLFVTAIMYKPFTGEPVAPTTYFKGTALDHLWGIVGGSIWAVGMTLNVIASGVASPAVSYGLGQGATLVAAIWGVFVWREFKGGSATVNMLLNTMFIAFFLGLALIIWTKA